MKFLSLFAGIGGLDLGLERAGMECVGQVEIDPFCRAVLAKHWPDVKRMEDVRDVRGDEFGRVDLVCGGVPCQPASCAGKRKGADDERWLWPEFSQIVRATGCSWFLAENVRGFLSLSVAGGVIRDLEGAGYEVRTVLLGAHHVGAPHRRDRIWIVGRLAHAGGNGWDGSHGQGRIGRGVCETSGIVADADLRGLGADGAAATGRSDAHERGACGFCGYPFDHEALGKYGCPNCNGEGLADTKGPRREGHEPAGNPRPEGRFAEHGGGDGGREGGRWPARPGERQHEWEAPRLVDAGWNGRSGSHGQGGIGRGVCETSGRISKSSLGLAVDGLPRRLAGLARRSSLKALGNAVVPQVAEVIGRAIMASTASST